MALFSSNSPEQLRQVERLLDRLPVAVYRLEIGVTLPITTKAPLLAAALAHHTRLDFANPAFAALHGATPAGLLGRSLADLAPASLIQPAVVERFVAGGFEVRGAEIRLGDNGSPRYFRAEWFGVVEGPNLVGIWGALTDVSAERDLARQVALRDGGDDEIVGTSPAIRRVLEKVDQVAGGDTTVLITGETGTGKELIARAIHARSRRGSKPLVAVNCGAISSTLVESELFGHEKGAFTGAAARKIGRFELADGGTLFLDEIGDLPLDLQVKLLRVLEEGEFVRVGGTETIRVDVRVIAATHRDLPAAVKSGAFRQDLYYRLNVFPIRSPALRDRREDIPLLTRHFVSRYERKLGKRIESIPEPVLDALVAYGWPGNIRELANLVERSVIISQGPLLQLGEWVTGQYQPVVAPADAQSHTLEELEREHIVKTLERTRWKVSGPGGAAEVLNLKPTTLEARMKKLGIVRP